ncbi:PH domain-containing protein [Paenibacillus sp. NPDC057967]|uniref:PH domain-containing protein n=1 Tax=Paenibacillus sp. NPDC057967 TaxID=3346293 RepID=UPI0036DAC431
MVLILAPIVVLPILKILESGQFSIVHSLISLFGIVLIPVILGIYFGIRYLFEKEALVVRTAFIKSVIPYTSIIKVQKSVELWTGFRILSSRDAITIFHKNGEVKISPADRGAFLKEIHKHCPQVKLEVDL